AVGFSIARMSPHDLPPSDTPIECAPTGGGADHAISSDAVRQARSDPDHDRGARGLGEARLPGSPALAGGVLQAGDRPWGARPRGDRGVERDRLEGAALGILEMLRSAAPD